MMGKAIEAGLWGLLAGSALLIARCYPTDVGPMTAADDGD
ncbi:uncharacterized protein SOCE836_052490 [Sorangium cellulosum]|uniref:Uncharacterized protein n=1 Tax=Sorangium cellulosum TaxID=56 RepID=A0A4P2QSR5_SORCE|nr:uncharacterized protein SOCE836_052490 [Sorangium cellulosum]WCQ92471.1 hypothetical protein NQZ70_05212 [Sorangium sp. Soce836]